MTFVENDPPTLTIAYAEGKIKYMESELETLIEKLELDLDENMECAIERMCQNSEEVNDQVRLAKKLEKEWNHVMQCSQELESLHGELMMSGADIECVLSKAKDIFQMGTNLTNVLEPSESEIQDLVLRLKSYTTLPQYNLMCFE